MQHRLYTARNHPLFVIMPGGLFFLFFLRLFSSPSARPPPGKAEGEAESPKGILERSAGAQAAPVTPPDLSARAGAAPPKALGPRAESGRGIRKGDAEGESEIGALFG